MPSFRRKTTADEAAEEGERMRPDEVVAPKPERKASVPAEDASKQPEKPKNKGPAKVIAFANQKGGVAKTTTALNLAVAFKESGHRVLACDMDPQGNLTMSQGVDPDKVEKSMFDVLVHHIPIKEIIVER